MKTIIFTLFASALFTCVWANDEINIKVAGLRVVAEGKGDPFKGGVRPFNWNAGTSVSIMASLNSNKNILCINHEKSEITSATDNKGTDLKTPKDTGKKNYGSSRSFGWENITDDQKYLSTEVELPNLPSKGSTHILLKGNLTLQCASLTEKHQSSIIEVKKNTSFKVHQQEFKIKSSGKPSWGKQPFQIELESEISFKLIKSIIWKDKNGEIIENQLGGSGSFALMGKNTYFQTYTLNKELDAFQVEIEFWSDFQEVTKNFEIKTSISLTEE